DARRARSVALGEHIFAHFDQGRDLDRAGARIALDGKLREKLVEHGLQLAFGPGISEICDRLALEYGIDGRNRLDLKLACDEAIRIDIDLCQHDALVGIVGGDLFENGSELFARAAPFRPEIEDDELRHRRLDDVAAERFDRFLFLRVQTQSGHDVIAPLLCGSLAYVGITPPMPTLRAFETRKAQ